MLKRIFAIFRARNLEFVRDRGTMAWNFILPVMLMLGLSFIFSADRPVYTVGVLQSASGIDVSAHPFLETRFIDFVVIKDEATGLSRIARHQLDLLVQFEGRQRYWINPDSRKGYFAELALLESDSGHEYSLEKAQIEGDAIRYVDWVLPGILGMNMMFSSLFGVGYVVVRYRKNGFLKRLRATPLRSVEFVIAQVVSRLMLIVMITSFLFLGTKFFLDTRMDGSYLTLLVVLIVGAISLISLGLMISARVASEELAGGFLNMVTWPMMMLSGVWFSLESANEWVQRVSNIFPLTHVLDAARAVMIDGAGFVEIAPQLTTLVIMSTIFLSFGALVFRWHPS
ncbi:MAG: ABC transporter permease [Proteobacteria bacterium]|nr:ABC transporter permease [Pseudomonadota bacterium]